MFKYFINRIVSRYYSQQLPTRLNAFSCQKKLFLRLLRQYSRSPLYTTLGIKQEEFRNLDFSSLWIKWYIAQYPLIEYREHILPLVEKQSWITQESPDFYIVTSGTSDANAWWKIIPSQEKSLQLGEQQSIKRTLSCYLSEYFWSSLLYGSSFWLTAPFDTKEKKWYISGCMRYFSYLVSSMMYPSQKILSLTSWQEKKYQIIQELLMIEPSLRSIHWVPTWPLEIIDQLVIYDKDKAIKILAQLEYVSVWGGPALDYKKQFEQRIRSLWCTQAIAGSNNHNASEWFLWSQVRNFFDLDYHWMSPMMKSNFYLFVPIQYFGDYKNNKLSYKDMILQSHLLHEVEYNQEYLMMFANDRIPRLYNIKDKVLFQKNDTFSDTDTILEYLVTWRYGMSSNLFNEHLELEHLESALDRLLDDWFEFDRHAFLFGMQIDYNNGIFHCIIESETPFRENDFINKLDIYLSQSNSQRKIFRMRQKIHHISLHILSPWTLRNGLIVLGKMHEQSKIPHLSDNNYKEIIEPLLNYLSSH